MNRLVSLLTLTLSILFLALALPDAMAIPDNISNADQYMRVGAAGTWARQWTTPTTSGTAGLVLETPGDNSYVAGDPHLFLWGSSVRICCNTNAAVFAWQMDTGTTIAASGLITDAVNGNGPGPTFRVESGCIEDMPLRSAFRPESHESYRAGRRSGFCTGTTSPRHLGAPCDADGDCVGGSCRTTCIVSNVNYCATSGGAPRDPFNMIRGVYLQSFSTTTAADCYITETK